MPSTVVRITDNTFRGRQLLNSITAPGCVDFGYKARKRSGSNLTRSTGSHTRPVRYETFPSNFRTLRKTSNAAQAALRHSHPFLTLAKRIGLEPKYIP